MFGVGCGVGAFCFFLCLFGFWLVGLVWWVWQCGLCFLLVFDGVVWCVFVEVLVVVAVVGWIRWVFVDCVCCVLVFLILGGV